MKTPTSNCETLLELLLLLLFWTGKFQEETNHPPVRFLRVSHTMDGDMTTSESVKFDWPRYTLLTTKTDLSNQDLSLHSVKPVWAGSCWRWIPLQCTRYLSGRRLKMTRAERTIRSKRKRRRVLHIHWRTCVTLVNQSHLRFHREGSCTKMKRWVVWCPPLFMLWFFLFKIWSRWLKLKLKLFLCTTGCMFMVWGGREIWTEVAFSKNRSGGLHT